MPESAVSSTYLSLNAHVIFATKGRAATIGQGWRAELHAYIGGTVRGLGGVPIAVGGVADHIHLLVGLKATQNVADLIREVKKASSVWVQERCPAFAWQTGYAAFSISPLDLGAVVAYIANQEEHHRKVSSLEELRKILAEFGVPYDERFLD
ncbi:MAG: hypothetical protein HONBIEJF_00559 [Fimbriimonadaceae bacterium]|nr:hypothetical protein [Fimbriimonadaceae bacterium]